MVMRATMASLLVAVAVGVASLLQTPKYETSAQVWVDQEQGDQQTNLAGNLAGGPGSGSTSPRTVRGSKSLP
jgi:uncharacterized protein involved in exopolysaccharide biosynthesis